MVLHLLGNRQTIKSDGEDTALVIRIVVGVKCLGDCQILNIDSNVVVVRNFFDWRESASWVLYLFSCHEWALSMPFYQLGDRETKKSDGEDTALVIPHFGWPYLMVDE